MNDEEMVHKMRMKGRRHEFRVGKHGRLNTDDLTVTLVCFGEKSKKEVDDPLYSDESKVREKREREEKKRETKTDVERWGE